VTKVIKLARANPADVAGALAKGAVIVPILGGYCVLATEPEPVKKRFGNCHRLVRGFGPLVSELSGIAPDRAGTVLKILAGPVVGVLRRTGLTPATGVALATEPLARGITEKAAAPVWLGVPDEPLDLGQLQSELGNWVTLTVVPDSEPGPGPTVIDFTQEPVVVDRRGKRAILDLERELQALVRLGPDIIFSVLVVCTGNSCRSPMAAGLLAKLLEGERVWVSSAGTGAPEGSAPTAWAVEVMAGLGIDISRHRARRLTKELVESADLILVMERHHQEYVVEAVPEAKGKVRFLGSYPAHEELAIDDPIGRPIEVYQQVLKSMQGPLERVAQDIRRRLGKERGQGVEGPRGNKRQSTI